MLMDSVQTVLFSASVNPLLRFLINRFDVECPEDGSLLLNSLRDFLGGDSALCLACQRISSKVAMPFYELGIRFLHIDKEMLRQQFLDKMYGEAWLRGFGLMMKGIEKFGVQMPFTPAGPFEIVWNITYRCNLRCKHCYEDAGRERPELSTEEVKQVLDGFSRTAGIGLPALSFSGGEPLMRKDFFDIAAYAKKRVGYVSIASNGTLLNKYNVKRIKDTGIDYVEISLDGATPAVHDEFRGVPGAFDKALEGVENCVEQGVGACIATVLHRDNIDELDKLIGLAKRLGTRFMHFNYIPTGRAKAYAELDLTPEQRLHVLETIGKEVMGLYMQQKDEELKYGKSNVTVDKFFSTCPQYASVTKRLSQEHGEKFMVEAHYAAKKGVENLANFLGGCGAGRLYCCLEPNGDIKPCVFFQTNKNTVLGNILRDDFDEIWDSHPLLWKLRIREDLQDFTVKRKRFGCASCPDKFICGGCRARAYAYFGGDVRAPDIGCIHNKPLWEHMTSKAK